MVRRRRSLWLQKRTLVEAGRFEHTWAGLRTFASNDMPIVGYEADVEGFFQLAGQVGLGTTMARALGHAAASLITKAPLPEDLLSLGVITRDLSPTKRGLPVLPRSMRFQG